MFYEIQYASCYEYIKESITAKMENALKKVNFALKSEILEMLRTTRIYIFLPICHNIICKMIFETFIQFFLVLLKTTSLSRFAQHEI